MAASDSGIDSQSSPELSEEPPMSRTHQYRHMIKPLLERKRRARINRCLDELKDLMVAALQKDGESITKLEKADVLELTVRHLRKLKAHGSLGLGAPGPGPSLASIERYRAGYSLAASEISKFVTSGASGLEVTVSARLLHHLSASIRNMESLTASASYMLPPPPLNIPPSPMMMSPGSHHKSATNLSEYLSPSKLDALRYSLGGPQSPPNLVRPETVPPPPPYRHSAPRDDKSRVLVPRTDKEDDKAWRPWNLG